LIVTIPGRGYRFVGQSRTHGLIIEQRTVAQIVIDEFGKRETAGSVSKEHLGMMSGYHSGYADSQLAAAD
jgi:DNA-binding winged helix-turn-helix (wHTH) protein